MTQHQRFIDLFALALKEKWKYKKTPSGTYEQWVIATTESHIFLKKKFVVWLAYFITGKRCKGKGHYLGQAVDMNTYNAFRQESAGFQEKVASALCYINVHDSVLKASKDLEDMVNKQHSANKRRCIEQPIPALSSTISATMPSTNNTQHTISNAGPSVIETPRSSEAASDSPALLNDQAVLNYELPEDPQTSSDSKPDFARLGMMFPINLHNAIQQHDDKADVSITFPPSGDCIICLAILPNKVQHLAMKLFELNVEMDGPMRYLLSDKGRKSMPRPAVREQGIATHVISELLGFQIQQGIESSSIRRKETREGLLNLTACGEIELSNNSAECAYLFITTGTDVGISIYSQLFE